MSLEAIIESLKEYKSQRKDLQLPEMILDYITIINICINFLEFIQYNEKRQVINSFYKSKHEYSLYLTDKDIKRMKEVLGKENHEKIDKTVKALNDYNDYKKNKNKSMPPPKSIEEALDNNIENLEKSIFPS